MTPAKRNTLGSNISISKGKKHSITENPSDTSKRLLGIDDLRNDNLLRYSNDKSGTEALPEDVLIAWDGANAGTIGYGKSGLIGSTIARLRIKEINTLFTPFLGSFLQSKFNYLRQTATGATIPHINRKALERIVLPELKFADQIRIAHLLNKVEGLIAQRKKNLQQLDDLLKSFFLEIFGDPVRNEKRWDTSSIDGLCEDIIDCPHSTPTYSDEKTGYFCVRSSDIVNGYLDLNKTLQVDHSIYEERIKRYTPRVGDIVYSREGGRLGNAARILGNEKICLGQRIMLFKLNAENEGNFFWAILESASFKSKLQGLVGGGGAPRVNIKDLKKIFVIKPPIDDQIEFSNIVQRIDQIKSHYQQSLTELENLYGAMCQKAFRGELELSRVPMPAAADLPGSDQLHSAKQDDSAPKEIKTRMVKSSKNLCTPNKSFEEFLCARKGEVLTATALWRELKQVNFENQPLDFESFKNLVMDYLDERRWLEQVYAEVSVYDDVDDSKVEKLKEKKVALRIRDDS